jgi:hypothetical protein
VDENNEEPTPDADEDGKDDAKDESQEAGEVADGEGLQKQRKQQQPRKKIPPKTTGRKNMENKRVKFTIRRRVRMQRFQLYHILTINDKQHACTPKNVPNNYSFIGTFVSRGNGRSNWNVHFDVLLCDEN